MVIMLLISDYFNRVLSRSCRTSNGNLKRILRLSAFITVAISLWIILFAVLLPMNVEAKSLWEKTAEQIFGNTINEIPPPSQGQPGQQTIPEPQVQNKQAPPYRLKWLKFNAC